MGTCNKKVHVPIFFTLHVHQFEPVRLLVCISTKSVGTIPHRDIVQRQMVIGGGVFHNAILLPMDGDRLLKQLGPGLLSGALTPGENAPRDMTDSPFPPLKKRGELGYQSLHSRPLFSFFMAQSTQRNLLVCQKLNENPCSPL